MLAGTQPSRSEEVGNPGRGPLWRYTLEKNVRRSRNEVKGQLCLRPKRLSFVGDTSRRKRKSLWGPCPTSVAPRIPPGLSAGTAAPGLSTDSHHACPMQGMFVVGGGGGGG